VLRGWRRTGGSQADERGGTGAGVTGEWVGLGGAPPSEGMSGPLMGTYCLVDQIEVLG
jgi:hypothetical protein